MKNMDWKTMSVCASILLGLIYHAERSEHWKLLNTDRDALLLNTATGEVFAASEGKFHPVPRQAR